MKNPNSQISIVLFALAVLTSCKQINQSFNDTLHGQPRQSKEDAFFKSNSDDSDVPNFLADAHALEQAEIKLKNIPELKGKTLHVFNDMHMYDDGRIMLQLQDPDTLANVNEYDYSSDKEWGPKQPVKVGSVGADDISKQTIPLDSVHFATVAKLEAMYADSAKRYGSTTRLNHIYYVEDAHRWYCNDIEGTRNNYQIYFNPDGTVKEFTKQ